MPKEAPREILEKHGLMLMPPSVLCRLFFVGGVCTNQDAINGAKFQNTKPSRDDHGKWSPSVLRRLFFLLVGCEQIRIPSMIEAPQTDFSLQEI